MLFGDALQFPSNILIEVRVHDIAANSSVPGEVLRFEPWVAQACVVNNILRYILNFFLNVLGVIKAVPWIHLDLLFSLLLQALRWLHTPMYLWISWRCLLALGILGR